MKKVAILTLTIVLSDFEAIHKKQKGYVGMLSDDIRVEDALNQMIEEVGIAAMINTNDTTAELIYEGTRLTIPHFTL